MFPKVPGVLNLLKLAMILLPWNIVSNSLLVAEPLEPTKTVRSSN